MFVDGGAFSMSLLSLELIALLFAAWKAPAWVKELGLLPLATALVTQFIGIVMPILFFGALRSMFITLSYALLIFLLSLVIRIVQKPRV